MMKVFAPLFTTIVLVITSGCSLPMNEAYAPTSPPKVEKSNFEATQLIGQYQATTSVMFTWPIDRWDPKSESYVALSFDEKVESRSTISRLSEEKVIYEEQYKKQRPLIEAKYTKLKSDLVGFYKNNKCYSLCDPEDFACEPDNPDNYPQYTWKTPESDEEAQLIQACQKNELEQEGVDSAKAKELQEAVRPAKEAAQGLLQAVGDRNFFNGLKDLQLRLGTFKVCVGANNGPCIKADQSQPDTLVRITFSTSSGQDYVFSNKETDSPDYFVKNVMLDAQGGFLTFTIPAVDLERDQHVYGSIDFDLELNPRGDTMHIAGDFLLSNHDEMSQRIGRFDSTGTLSDLK